MWYPSSIFSFNFHVNLFSFLKHGLIFGFIKMAYQLITKIQLQLLNCNKNHQSDFKAQIKCIFVYMTYWNKLKHVLLLML